MNRKGWLRIVEASIAVLIILSVLFFLYNKQARIADNRLADRVEDILTEEATKPAFREAVFNEDKAALTDAIRAHIPETTLAFEIVVCGVDDVCGKSMYTEGNVYAGERIVSNALSLTPSETATPKKVRLFVWRVTL